MKDVVVLDHGFGNVRSAVRALKRLGAAVTLTADAGAALRADGLVVPGVGAFGAVMAALAGVDGAGVIERRLAGGRPVLGICVGMQVMFAAGEELGVRTTGLGQWPDRVTRLPADIVPHMGWSEVEPPRGTALFAGVERERFYFVHSYAAQTFALADTTRPPFRPPLATWAVHGTRFVAAVENGPLSATQFHPEKSSDAGATLLENWLHTL